MILVVSIADTDSLKDVDLSIANVSVRQAEILSNLCPIHICGIDKIGAIDVNRYSSVLLTQFRPTDIVSRPWIKDIFHQNAKIVVNLLIHEQDKSSGFLKECEDFCKKNRIIIGNPLVNNANVGTPLRMPIKKIGTDIDKTKLLNMIEGISKPTVTLFGTPSVRRIMLFGIPAVIEAAFQYGEPSRINILTRGILPEHVNMLLKTLVIPPNTEIAGYSYVSREEMTNIALRSTTMFFPSIDEGLNLIPSEYGWVGNDLILSDIPANTYKKQITKRIYKLYPSILSGGKPGEDEFNSVTQMNLPSFSEVVSTITNSMKSWDQTKSKMLKKAHSVVLGGDNYKEFVNDSIRIFGIRKPYRRCKVVYL